MDTTTTSNATAATIATTTTNSTTHYETLGVSPQATYEEIKAAFSKLALQSHPDKQRSTNNNKDNHNSASTFRSIQQAWQVLRDTTTRQQYDQELKQIQLNQQAKLGSIVTLHMDDPGVEWAQDEETGDTLVVYDCRCGEEVIFEGNTDQVDCPGCCFVYCLQRT
eukprot:Nitzschia sp. Nitz4//scaffold101_size76361//66590//67084//NITZ4_005614-RA/size76361-processed-gene-0.45-mRNA-1//-1//CDS//3329532194//2726//frame0